MLSLFDELAIIDERPLTPEERFWAFHESNKNVYIELRKLALDLVDRGRTHFGIAMIYERLRYEYALRTKGDPYLLNNDFRAFYSRLLMKNEPRLSGVFETRKSRADEIS